MGHSNLTHGFVQHQLALLAAQFLSIFLSLPLLPLLFLEPHSYHLTSSVLPHFYHRNSPIFHAAAAELMNPITVPLASEVAAGPSSPPCGVFLMSPSQSTWLLYSNFLLPRFVFLLQFLQNVISCETR